MDQKKMQEFILELKTPFELLDCTEAFDNLPSDKERRYLHYYTKVSTKKKIRHDEALIDLNLSLQGVLVWLIDFIHPNVTGFSSHILASAQHYHR